MDDLDGWNAEKIGESPFCCSVCTHIDALLSALLMRAFAFFSRFTTRSLTINTGSYSSNNLHKALAQKARSDQQAAAQAPGKRNQIAFASSTTRTSQTSRSSSSILHAPVKKDGKDKDTRKFEPYESGGVHRKTRPRTQW